MLRSTRVDTDYQGIAGQVRNDVCGKFLRLIPVLSSDFYLYRILNGFVTEQD